MIVYFADRPLNILGQASTELPDGLVISDDLKTEDIETGVAVFDCKVHFDPKSRARVEEYTEVGNYILRSEDGENEFYQIIESEIDTQKQQVYIYAEDNGMDLLNEVVGKYEADKAYPISHYIEKYAAGAGFVIGVNEAKDLTRKLSWDSESTAAARIASVATQFDGCEISFSFDIDGLMVVKKYINIYKERGKDIGITLRLNQDIDKIVVTKSIANLATALQCTGGTPDDENTEDDIDPVPITLEGYTYDDGDFYVEKGLLKSRTALKRWSRLLYKDDDTKKSGGHIVKQYSYDTLSQKTLCSRAIAELKKIRDMEINYEVEISKFPENVKIGDRINIVDDAGELYVSTRILKLETSVAEKEKTATLGEYLIKTSGISAKVAELADEFAKNAVSAKRALTIAKNAKAQADTAKDTADSALTDAANAQAAAEEAQTAANTATQSATDANAKADNAQAAVDIVENSVAELETTVTNAQQAATNAQQAAQTAQTKADEAAQAAANAQADADDAKAAVEIAQGKAETAITKAEAAQTAADTAKTDAATAQQTATAAKEDTEKANSDIISLGNRLDTVSNTMTADYARKTDLTEAQASLQTQITQNAGQIEATASRVQTIDETANNAQEQAQAAQTAADNAKTQADKATADAEAAQTAADNAATAAANAQSEANTAKEAAATAKGVADKAEADLETAKADLATVTSRVGATEEEIAAAQEAVEAAQTAADKAKADALTATQNAATAQSTADTAVSNANAAQTKANEAAQAAANAQETADKATGDASKAQAKADEAATAAATAQQTANTAKTNAQTAQNKANEAATAAANAQKAADDADAKAAQAASDLATAQQNLANVTSRVDATEEEVAAAQQAVNTAQAAADKAKEDAQAAQTTADTAKANAATAQTAANNAKTAADNAQAAAEAAQADADAAQEAVNALSVRVTTAETKITQNSEQIELRAKKTEVTQALGGYYTKEQTDAAITVKADSITQTVSATYATKTALSATDTKATNAGTAAANAQTTANTAKTNAATAQTTANAAKTAIDGLEIGGRNLALGTADWSKWYNQSGVTVSGDTASMTAAATTPKYGLIEVVPGKTYTASVDIKSTTAHTTSDGMALLDYLNSSKERVTYEWVKATYSTAWVRHTYTFTVPNNSSIVYLTWSPRDNANNTVYWRHLKIEKGNRATDWTKAPEDLESRVTSAETKITQNTNDIQLRAKKTEVTETLAGYYTKSETEAKIKQSSDSITLSVSNTYATKSALSTTDTKATNAATAANNAKTAADNAQADIDGLQIGGRNMIIRSTEVPNTWLDSTGAQVTQSGHSSSDYIAIEPGQTYAFSRIFKSGTYWRNNWYDVNQKFIARAPYNVGNFIWTAPSNAHYIRCSYPTDSKPKMEKGNRQTDWTPAPEDVEADFRNGLSRVETNVQKAVADVSVQSSEIAATVKKVEEQYKESIDGVNDEISSLQQEVSAKMSAEAVEIQIRTAMENGTEKVVTGTGFIFDGDGLTIAKSGGGMETKITEDGMKVYQNEEEVLSADSDGVNAKNLHATTFLTVGGRSRFENYGADRTGCFWIGG